jgi:hypothetical protein
MIVKLLNFLLVCSVFAKETFVHNYLLQIAGGVYKKNGLIR